MSNELETEVKKILRGIKQDHRKYIIEQYIGTIASSVSIMTRVAITNDGSGIPDGATREEVEEWARHNGKEFAFKLSQIALHLLRTELLPDPRESNPHPQHTPEWYAWIEERSERG